MKLKMKTLSLCLAIALMISLLPIAAVADGVASGDILTEMDVVVDREDILPGGRDRDILMP